MSFTHGNSALHRPSLSIYTLSKTCRQPLRPPPYQWWPGCRPTQWYSYQSCTWKHQLHTRLSLLQHPSQQETTLWPPRIEQLQKCDSRGGVCVRVCIHVYNYCRNESNLISWLYNILIKNIVDIHDVIDKYRFKSVPKLPLKRTIPTSYLHALFLH